MYRKLLLASVAGLGLLSPLAVTTVSAHEFRPEFHHERYHECEYRVFYRDHCRPCWEFAGKFCNRREAERCAEGYRCRGLEVEIR